VVEHISFFVTDTPLHGGLVSEHRPDRLPEGFGAVDREQDSLLWVEAAINEV